MGQQHIIRDAAGVPIYYWQVIDSGIRFNFEYFAEPDTIFNEDLEVIFTMPTSEFIKIYKKFGIDLKVPMPELIQYLSDTGKGEELVEELVENIKQTDRFTW
jgi:hypothetical protein